MSSIQDAIYNAIDDQKINLLENQINAYDNRIAEANTRINSMSRAYDSLVQFQTEVRKTHDNFNTVTSKHKKILAPLDSMAHDCKGAKSYGQGMHKTLTGFGNNVVGLAFIGLTASIQRKLRQYSSDISATQRNIDTWNRNKSECQDRIKQEKDKEKR